MHKTLGLGYGILKKEVVLLVRYPVNTGAYVLTLYGIFLLIFFGGRTFGGDAFSDSLGAIIVGYFLVTMAFTAFNELAHTFSREAAWGTLEQLYMSEVGFGRTTALIAVVRTFLSLLWGLVMLVLMIVTTEKTISIDVASVLPVAILAIASLIGVGFIFGGAAILYKRISNVFNLMQFGIFGLVAAPVESYPLLKLLPLTQGSYLLRLVMNQGYRVWEIPAHELGVLVVTGVGYGVLGYVIFKGFVTVAKNRGVMGHY